MKKFTLFLMSAVASLCSFAQSVGEHGELIGQYGAIYQMAEDAPEAKTYQFFGVRAVYDEGDEETPAGVYTFSVARQIEVVEYEDGTLFFKDLVTDAKFGSYVKGYRVHDEEGDETIHIPVGQVLAHDNNYNSNILLMRFLFVDNEEGTEIRNCYDDIVYSVVKMGESESFKQLNDQAYVSFYGAMWQSTEGIEAIGDAAVTMSWAPADGENDTQLELPAGLVTKTYNCYAYSYAMSEAYNDFKYVNYDVEIGIDGEDFYLKGLYFYQDPDAINPVSNVLKGKIVDGVVTFPQHQLIGIDGRGAMIYAVAMGITADGNYFEARDSWTLEYDEEYDIYDGGESIVRFNPISYWDPNVAPYDSIDEIMITPKGADGINTVLRPTSENTYDLSGRRVMGAKGGLYIVNGKKVIK